MARRIEIISPLDYPEWDEFLIQRSAGVFLSSGWIRAVAESYRYSPILSGIFDGEGLAGGVPVMEVKSLFTGLRGVSLPFSDYSGPVTDEDGFKKTFCAITDYGKKRGWDYVELRSGDNLFGAVEAHETYLVHSLRLAENPGDVYSGLSQSTKRNIKKAAKTPIEVKGLATSESVKDFYSLHCITRRQNGIPPQPFYFFKKIYEHVISKGGGTVFLASLGDKNIAGALFFQFGRRAFFRFGASVPEFLHLRPNNLVMWKAIEWHCSNGYKSLCLGRTDINDEGLKRFKSGWGSDERAVKYYRYDLKRDAFIKGMGGSLDFRKGFLSKMPLPALKAAGRLLYRHIG